MESGSKRKASEEVAEGVKVEASAPPTTLINNHAETINNGPVTINNHHHTHIHEKVIVERVIVKRVKLTPGLVDGVMTKDGKEPDWWVCPEKKTPQTNVSYVSWFKRRNKWEVKKIDETGKRKRLGSVKTLDEACALRRDVVDGNMGPGELVCDSATGGWGVTKCGSCCKPYPLAAFAPAPCGRNARTYAAFVQAGDDLHSGDPERVASGKARLAEAQTNKKGDTGLRTSTCRRCRASQHKSQTEGDSAKAVCYKAAKEIRAHTAEHGCAKCAELRPESFENDHGDRKGLKKCADKDLKVTDYMAWARKYGKDGPEMMWREYQRRIEQILCKCCHFLEDTHDGARGVDSKTLPLGSQERRQREQKEQKTAYNNRRKREHVNRLGDQPGSCFHCGDEMMCIKGNERAFQWMHDDPLTKEHNVGTLVSNGHSFEKMKPLIDAQIGISRLGCANCHWCCETLPALQVDNEEWDALEERWIYGLKST